ncbi:MAG: SWIM zinc finger family protein, partial [Bacteroidetes bacterium]|nr:SWIM zinc finger family protein [Bacteroidota bacterium]
MANYGRTWWGEQWLKALDRIDFSNRLPRGRSYANKGMVTSIKIAENRIAAKVEGSRPKPYDISIVVPPFFDAEKEVFIEKIKNDPLVVSQLLNRQLPKELLEIAEHNNIKIFPQSWQDIKLNCSCPDWAVPCKHLAAVIYTIANEIDQNPFLVFLLHSFDLVNELSVHKVHLHELEKENIFSIHNCIASAKTRATKNPETPDAPDFSLIENLLPTLPLLFTANPLFYNGDFRAIIQNHYKRNAKQEQVYLNHLKNEKPVLLNDYRYYDFRVIAYQNGELAFVAKDTDENTYEIKKEQLLTLLAQTESKHLDNYLRSFILLYRTFRFCNVLAERGALLPRLFKTDDEHYRIQWIPALINASVKKVFDDLLLWYPVDLLQISNLSVNAKKKSLSGKSAKSTPPLLPAKPEEALTLLCSFFANTSVQACYNNAGHSTKAPDHDRKINELFFDNKLHRFENFSEKEIPNTIQLWLSRFYISKKDFSPVLKVNEKENNGFEVEVLIKDNTAPMQPVESLYAFMKSESDKQFSALKDLHLLTHYLPDLNHAIASKGKEKLHYTSQTFAEVLTGILPAIRLFGIQTLLPKSLQYLLKPRVTVSLTSNGNNKKYFSLTDLLDYDWRVALGNSFVSKEEFLSLATQSAGLVKIRDQYVMMDQEEIEKIIKKLTQPSAPKAFTLLQAALSGDYEGAPVQIDEALKNKINELLKSDGTSLPLQLNARLRHYQQRGFSWLYKNAQLGLGSL